MVNEGDDPKEENSLDCLSFVPFKIYKLSSSLLTSSHSLLFIILATTLILNISDNLLNYQLWFFSNKSTIAYASDDSEEPEDDITIEDDFQDEDFTEDDDDSE